ncbi:hypothetical protein FYJ24_11870 [Actinomycetaceae bacterium WB03_NA08]|uniref:Uncharacterized protein n=1 Tax=Scrofimicrobium canadense TaxID=2652290 RepID=A0A6N7WB31_9ACTO|nr:hypothetical protein [Scrofimicrobium canadense]MSS85426.1 hypothetical protein [Scrofimicrobium canadense]
MVAKKAAVCITPAPAWVPDPYGRYDHDHDLAEVDYYWAGVRGRAYYGSAYADLRTWGKKYPNEVRRFRFQIACEPDNPHDGTAVKLMIDGRLAGYVAAHLNGNIFDIVHYLNATGSPCEAFGEYSWMDPDNDGDYEEGAWVALPTFRWRDQLIDQQAIFDQFRERLWDRAPEDLREQIEKNGFHFDDQTLSWFVDHRSQAPLVPLPSRADSEYVTPATQQCLHDLRHERNERRVRERIERRLAEDAARESRRAEKRREREEREAKARELLVQGYSKTRVQKETRLSWERISEFHAALGIESVNEGHNQSNSEARQRRTALAFEALALQEQGSTRRDIASVQGCSVETVKLRLRDARFWRTPEQDGDRLENARKASSKDDAGLASLSDGARKTARRDVAVLREMHPHLLG